MSIQKNLIDSGRAIIGIEFGSTRIKAVLTDDKNMPIAQGSYEWENLFENGVWTYHEKDFWKGLCACFESLCEDVKQKYNATLKSACAMGISGMMHGYLAFDKDMNLLSPFRTWRNSMTTKAAHELSELFDFNIPKRWSIAHLYHSILNGEEHVKDICYLTTLSGYIHYKLTGQFVLGIDEASGMFPIDAGTKNYNKQMLDKFDTLIAHKGYHWKLQDILPKVLVAGENAGTLTDDGAKLLCPTGNFISGVPMCPPEGDGGTGMVATNSVKPGTGNISAGTSAFAMLVLQKPMTARVSAIDIVSTPAGDDVAMIHANNCTSDINAWVNLFREFAKEIGINISDGELFEKLFCVSQNADSDCGGLLSYNYISGEPMTGIDNGAPLFVRTSTSNFTLSNFMRTHLYSALGVMRVGVDILKEQGIEPCKMVGHGGFFKTREVGQRYAAAALRCPVAVTSCAGEGGAWGIALLASYMVNKAKNQSLSDFLATQVFADATETIITPTSKDIESFDVFANNYKNGLNIMKAAQSYAADVK